MEAAPQQTHSNTTATRAPLGLARRIGGAVTGRMASDMESRDRLIRTPPPDERRWGLLSGGRRLVVDRLAVRPQHLGPGLADQVFDRRGQGHVVELAGGGVAVLVAPVEEAQHF